MSSTVESRNARLNHLFSSILMGKAGITKANYQQFIEAIYTQLDPAACLNRLVSSPKGLISVQTSMRIDLAPTFLNNHAAKLLKYVSAPELALVINGDLLRNFLLALVDPPIFWDAFVSAFKDGHLQDDAQRGFAGVLLQLVTIPNMHASSYMDLAGDYSILRVLQTSSLQDIRTLGTKLEHIAKVGQPSVAVEGLIPGPGGRHDNDKLNFRDIALLPTADELTSKEAPFLRPLAVVEHLEGTERVSGYLDNHFRLLREDMLCELREDLEIAMGKKKRSSRNMHVDNLKLLNVHYQPQTVGAPKATRWAISLECPDFIPAKEKNRKKWLQDNARILRHRSLSALLIGDNEIIAFPTIHRDLDLLAHRPPVVVLQLEGDASISTALLKLKVAERIRLVPVDTAVFAYAPILKALKEMVSVPLADELLFWTNITALGTSPLMPAHILRSLRGNPSQDLRSLLRINRPVPVILDSSQSASLMTGLEQSVSLIQGPPGTGKSFIGALLAKSLYEHTESTVLVVCYTNHALDQFLEDLLDIGIPESCMIRLGGKSTKRTESLSLYNARQAQPTLRFSKADWNLVSFFRNKLAHLDTALKRASDHYMISNPSYKEIMEYLEFNEPKYFDAFTVPASEDGMQLVTKAGKELGRTYLLNQWRNGWNAGVLAKHPHTLETSRIWEMPKSARDQKLRSWKETLLKEAISGIQGLVPSFNGSVDELDRKYSESNARLITSRRIIGCTTTAAAMYRDDILKAKPDVLLVEEAAEILESHILTAMSENTKQLILIGDHQQLRPKVNSFKLTVEKGEGYDLNRSLFERLILRGYPHQTLTKQHRMRPEISDLIRHLTYPDLVDAETTKARPNIRGLRDSVVFIHHEHLEERLPESVGTTDDTVDARTSSKTNPHEAEMVLKIVRYLGQQGYGTDKVVILTPYLGQLRALQTALKSTNDPVLNDLDAADLVRAGLVTEADAKIGRSPIRLATIDNYQGEESDIVIVSLTRSNPDHQIGFMGSPQRVNVLLSRARIGLIILGNAHTFQRARQGSATWVPLLDKMRSEGHLHDGLPIRCERHPDRIAVLRIAVDFDEKTPDGGCTQPCGAKLSCSHDCPSKCHQISDHSKMPCDRLMETHCNRGHRQPWRCRDGSPDTCRRCTTADMAAERKKQEAFKRQERKERDQREHNKQMAELDVEIQNVRQDLDDKKMTEDRKAALLQRQDDLQKLMAVSMATPVSTASVPQMPFSLPSTSPGTKLTANLPSTSLGTSNLGSVTDNNALASKDIAVPGGTKPSTSAQDDWQNQKRVHGEHNQAIDAIMDLVGLEEVKKAVLILKARVDTAKRQRTLMTDQRLNVAMLGNPGTGKTTVAKLYAGFLGTMEILPGTGFLSTTGERLANDGVSVLKKDLETLLQNGGGTVFIDEAYQLTTEQAGKRIIEFLLGEMDNNVGKLIFIFAGYNKEMERFFEHNQGLQSRVPYTFQFSHYDDDQLLDLLEKRVHAKFEGRMKVNDKEGIRGRFGRIAIRRLGRGRGRPGFGNARALQNLFDRICARQAVRLKAERADGGKPDDFLLVMEDLIGAPPSDVLANNPVYHKLQKLIGLEDVKQSVNSLLGIVKMNYERELKELHPYDLSLNRVFIGNPGTGKTTVAKLYGQILADLGFLSSGEVVVKSPSDFIGSVLGESEANTKAILSSAIGKVLVIDEAYMLNPASGSSRSDPYRTAVIDTLVAEIQNIPGEDRCVLLLGYKDKMEEMFQTVNPGLSRRFPMAHAFTFQDYTDSELLQALDLKLSSHDLSATEPAKVVAIDVLARLRNRPNFGNIGEVDNLLTKAKLRYQARQAIARPEVRSATAPFEPEDFDPDFDRVARSSSNLVKLFEDMVNSDTLIRQFGRYQQLTNITKAKGIDVRELIPTTFVFKGPPGTGKTTTARKIGQIYYDMGILATDEVLERSVSDLVGEYIGHTGPKTRKLLESALGRVLFIDEAYRLSEGRFAKEAIDELVSILTEEKFQGKLIVILAGYEQAVNQLLSVNPGLSSRFSEEVTFQHIPPSQCLEILKRELKKYHISVDALEQQSSRAYSCMIQLVQELSQLPSWGNARDMKTLSKDAASVALSSPESLVSSQLNHLTDEAAILCLQAMLETRRARTGSVSLPSIDSEGPQLSSPSQVQPSAQRCQSVQKDAGTSPRPEATIAADGDARRDADVLDDVWQQLQLDKEAEEREREHQKAGLQEAERALQVAEQEEEASKRVLQQLVVGKDRQDADDRDAEGKLEKARLDELQAKVRRRKLQAELEHRRQDAEKKRLENARVQSKIRELGLCPQGFRWICQSSGYRCAGGSHFIHNLALGL